MEDKKDSNILTNRRGLLKAGLAAIGAGAIALSGCSKNENEDIKDTASQLDSEDVIPKQTGIYEFSTPLPFDFNAVDKIAELNSKYKKSKVVSFYNNTPLPLGGVFNQWIQVNRGVNNKVKTYNDFKTYVKHATDSGFQFTYLLNSSKIFSQKDLLTFKNDFLYLLDFLKSIGCKDVKVGNTQVLSLLDEYAPNEFNLHASTVFEFHNVSQYNNLFSNYSNFKLIDVAIDENYNFKFLKALRKRYPDIKLEIMVTEPCLKGCPARISHSAEYQFCVFQCKNLQEKMGPIQFFLKNVQIFPWDLEYYSAIGVNNFKYLPGAMNQDRVSYTNVSGLDKYLSIAENGVEGHNAFDFFIQLYSIELPADKREIKLSSILPLFPKMKHFVKHGHQCASRCDVDCTYCMDCAKKMEKVLFYS